jgi:hypothetical protein
MSARLFRVVVLALLASLSACGAMTSLSDKTQVEMQWRDPKFTAPPMKTIFVISLMKVEPGGRDAVEDAIVARLATAGVNGVASHTVMPKDADQMGPTLEEAIKVSGAEGVLLVEVRAIGAFEPYTVGQTMTSLSPDTMASYNYLKQENVYQPGDYKVARISSQVYLPPMGRQVWIAFTHSFDAANLSRNLPDFTLKLVGALAKDGMVPAAPKPAS